MKKFKEDIYIEGKKRYGFRDIFLLYPWKKKHAPHENVTRPILKHIKLNEDHPQSLTYTQFRKIFKIYLKYTIEYILSGNLVTLPWGFGVFKMYKYKYEYRKRIDYGHLQRTGKIKYYTNSFTDNHGPVLKWNTSIFKYHKYRSFKASFNRRIHDYIMENKTNIMQWDSLQSTNYNPKIIKK
jgi:hypothetical protein